MLHVSSVSGAQGTYIIFWLDFKTKLNQQLVGPSVTVSKVKESVACGRTTDFVLPCCHIHLQIVPLKTAGVCSKITNKETNLKNEHEDWLCGEHCRTLLVLISCLEIIFPTKRENIFFNRKHKLNYVHVFTLVLWLKVSRTEFTHVRIHGCFGNRDATRDIR